MVSDYKRKTGRGDWSMIAMKKAVDKVLSMKMGYKLASRQYSVPRTTLARYVKILKQGDEVNLDLPLGPLKTVFDPKEEEELVTYFNDLEKRFFCLTTVNMRQMAYQLAVKHGKKHNFSRVKKMAGEDWAKSFLKRHPDLTIRKSRGNAGDRAMRANKETLDEFDHFLRGIYDEYKLTPDKIYNCGETGVSIVSKTKTKMRKEMGYLSHAKREQTVTVELCFNAAGYYMPPLMVFPEQKMSPDLLNHAPPGTIAECNASGGMTKDIFLKWVQHFIQFSGASPSNHVLLLVNSRVSHFKNIYAIEMAQQNGVILLGFPPHCTRRLQPIVSFIDRLSDHYDNAAACWLRMNTSRTISMFQISEIFGLAYVQAATIMEAINSFRICEIWLFDQVNFPQPDPIDGVDQNTQIDANYNPIEIDPEGTIAQIDVECTNAQLIVENTSKQLDVEDTITQNDVEDTNALAIKAMAKEICVENPNTRAVVGDTTKQIDTEVTITQIDVQGTNNQLAVENTTKQIDVYEPNTQFDVKYSSKQMEVGDRSEQIDVDDPYIVAEDTITTRIDAEDKRTDIDIESACTQLVEDTTKQIDVQDPYIVVEGTSSRHIDIREAITQIAAEDTITRIDVKYTNNQLFSVDTPNESNVDLSARVDVRYTSEQRDVEDPLIGTEVTISKHIDAEIKVHKKIEDSCAQFDINSASTHLDVDDTNSRDVADSSYVLYVNDKMSPLTSEYRSIVPK